VVSIDCGAIVAGWHGDAARTVTVGPAPDGAAGLMAACEEAMWQGLAAARPGARLTDISHAIETSARAAGRYGIVAEYTGHGIGTEMHMDPPAQPGLEPGAARCWPRAWRWPSSRC
jgi:methionyl aminopeptidase